MAFDLSSAIPEDSTAGQAPSGFDLSSATKGDHAVVPKATQQQSDADALQIKMGELRSAYTQGRSQDAMALMREITRMGGDPTQAMKPQANPALAVTTPPAATAQQFTQSQVPVPTPSQSQAPQEEPGWFQPGSKSDALVRGFSNGATFGGANYAGPAISAGIAKLTGDKRSIGTIYDDEKSSYRAGNDNAAEKQTGSYVVGNIAGGLAGGGGVAVAGAKAAKLAGGGVLGAVAGNVGVGAATGAAQGYAQHGDAKEAGTGAAWGGGFGALSPAIGGLVNRVGLATASTRIAALANDASDAAKEKLSILFNASPEAHLKATGETLQQTAARVSRYLKTGYVDAIPPSTIENGVQKALPPASVAQRLDVLRGKSAYGDINPFTLQALNANKGGAALGSIVSGAVEGGIGAAAGHVVDGALTGIVPQGTASTLLGLAGAGHQMAKPVTQYIVGKAGDMAIKSAANPLAEARLFTPRNGISSMEDGSPAFAAGTGRTGGTGTGSPGQGPNPQGPQGPVPPTPGSAVPSRVQYQMPQQGPQAGPSAASGRPTQNPTGPGPSSVPPNASVAQPSPMSVPLAFNPKELIKAAKGYGMDEKLAFKLLAELPPGTDEKQALMYLLQRGNTGLAKPKSLADLNK